MPVMSGLDLQQRLRELGSKLPIIFITAHEKHRIRQKALNAGAVDFLLKPLEKNVLLDAIQRALSNDTSLGKLVVTK
jgi:FixJ family two-component response regulator